MYFAYYVSEAYRNRVETIMNEIIASDSSNTIDYIPPLISISKIPDAIKNIHLNIL